MEERFSILPGTVKGSLPPGNRHVRDKIRQQLNKVKSSGRTENQGYRWRRLECRSSDRRTA